MNLKVFKENIDYISGILEHLEIEDQDVHLEFDVVVRSEDLHLQSKPSTPVWVEYDVMKSGLKKLVIKINFD